MKKLLVLFAIALVSNNIQAQNIEVRSDELDRLVWTKINERLITLGKKPIEYFEDSQLQAFAYRTADRINAEGGVFQHSPSDSITWWTNGGECLILIRTTAGRSYILDLQSGNLDRLADKIVQCWVNSPSHNRAISGELYVASTVANSIRYNESTGEFQVTSVWLSMYNPNRMIPKSGYKWIF